MIDYAFMSFFVLVFSIIIYHNIKTINKYK